MRRREFITLLGGATLARPLSAEAQQTAMPVIGFLISSSLEAYARDLAAFREGLHEADYVEGRNVAIEYRSADNHYDRLPSMAADLVRSQVAVIATASLPAALAAKAATTTIPIVFAMSADPVQLGLVASLSRSGNNLTGVTNLTLKVAPKRLELLHELVPMANVLALLVNPTNRNAEIQLRDLQAAARTLALQLHVLRASTENDIDDALSTLVKLKARGLVIGADAFFNSRSKQLATLALRYAVPAIYQYREFTAAGGLMSYGASRTAEYRLAGIYTGRILKGEKPTDLPVQQSTKIELFINLKTAKALGLTFPLPLLGRADEVIE